MPIIRVITLLLSLWALAACASLSSYDPPTVDLVGLAPGNSASGQSGLLVKLRVVNPNSRKLNIRSVYYDVAVEGHQLLNGASSEAATIPAYGENILELTATPSFTGVVSLLHSLISDKLKRDQLRYTLNAKLSVGGVPMPVRLKREGELSLLPGALESMGPALGI